MQIGRDVLLTHFPPIETSFALQEVLVVVLAHAVLTGKIVPSGQVRNAGAGPPFFSQESWPVPSLH